MSARDKRDPSVATKTDQHESFDTPTLKGIAPYRSAGEGGGADRTHIQEQSEQSARRAWGLGSLLVSLGAFASIPFALNESTFTAAMAATIGVGFGALASMTLRAYARERGAIVALYDRHITVEAGGSRREIPWDAIVSVSADYRVGEDRTLRAVALVSLALADKTRVLVPRAISGAGTLAHEVLARTREPLAQRAREAMDNGLRCELGAVTLTPEGIIAGNHLWAWAARPVARIDGPFLHVKALFDAMPPSTILIETVENLHVVLDLISSGYTPTPRDVAAPEASKEPDTNVATPDSEES